MRYKVKVKVVAEVEYTVEVEARNQFIAETCAAAKWRQSLPEDFVVEKTYVKEIDAVDTTQMSFECEECEKPVEEKEYWGHEGYHAECLKVVEARYRIPPRTPDQIRAARRIANGA